MKFAICNETFGNQPFEEAWRFARQLGYTGIELAPFTLFAPGELVDVRRIPLTRRAELRSLADRVELEIVGLHWLLARTTGFYLTSPDPAVQQTTTDYLRALVELCRDLGGKVLVLGSPQQRNLLPGVSYEQAEEIAAKVITSVMSYCEASDVTLALEPLGPSEGDFLPTAASAIALAQRVGSSHCRLHLDVKAMSSEQAPIPDILRASRDWLAHFHANDPNQLGPGMGEVDFVPILRALGEIGYDGWVSVEVFRYEPSPAEIARQSIENLRRSAGITV